MSLDSFKTRTSIASGSESVAIYSLPALERAGFPRVATLPFSLKILLENLLRREDNGFVKADDIDALASWDPARPVQKEISFMPARVLLQDFTGVPCVVDLAAMRDAIVALGGDAVELVVEGDTYDEAAAAAAEYALRTGATTVPAFDDLRTIAGQGTVGLEILDQLGRAPDVVVVPVGGGGLLAGVATLLREREPGIRVVGVEPAGAASMSAAMRAGATATPTVFLQGERQDGAPTTARLLKVRNDEKQEGARHPKGGPGKDNFI